MRTFAEGRKKKEFIAINDYLGAQSGGALGGDALLFLRAGGSERRVR